MNMTKKQIKRKEFMSDPFTERGLQNLHEEDPFETEMEEMNNPTVEHLHYPKFQYSIFVGGDKNQQIVIRSNDRSEFLAEIKRWKESIDLGQQKSANQHPQPTPNTQVQVCGIHGNPMTWKTGISKKTNQPYAFWACSTRNADGSYCQFKPTQNAH